MVGVPAPGLRFVRPSECSAALPEPTNPATLLISSVILGERKVQPLRPVPLPVGLAFGIPFLMVMVAGLVESERNPPGQVALPTSQRPVTVLVPDPLPRCHLGAHEHEREFETGRLTTYQAA
jgi:hypothetical protein